MVQEGSQAQGTPKTILVSYPKSGRTWVRYFLARYIEKRDGAPFHDNLPAPDWLCVTHDYFSSDDQMTCRKPYVLLKCLPRPEDHPIIWLIRDPRDVLVSWYYHNKYRHPIFKGTIDEFVDDGRFGIERQCTWLKKMAWFMDDHRNRKMTLKYEAIHFDPAEQFGLLVTFLFGSIDYDAFHYALNAARFKSMQAFEGNMIGPQPIATSVMGPRNGTQQTEPEFKVRRGKVGGYREELSSDTLARIGEMDAVKAAFEALGYPLDVPQVQA